MKENENRSKLLQLIQARPGLGVRDAGRRAGIPGGATAYHVEELVRHGKITTARYGGRRLLFPYKVAPKGLQLAMVVLLEDPNLYALYEWIRGNGPVAQQGILNRFPEPRATVQARLGRLVRGGLLKSGLDGRTRLYKAVET